jgi:outer membrane protein TolC
VRTAALFLALGLLATGAGADEPSPRAAEARVGVVAPSGPAPAGASGRVVLTFEDALRRALRANLGLGRARAEVSVADAQRRGALSAVLPRLNATGGYTRNDREVAFGTDEFSRVILPRNDWSLRFTVSQPIFAGLREQRAYQQAKESVRSAEHGVRITEDRILLHTAADYLAVVGGEALANVAEQTLTLARQRLKEAQDFFEAGETTRVDVLRAESAVKSAERQVAMAQRERDSAAGQLRIDLDMDGEFETSEPSPALPDHADEALLVQRAQETRGDVAQARSGLRIADIEIAKQKGAYLPTITADAGYVVQKTAFPSDKYGYAAVRFNVPIWQSGEIGARVAAASGRRTQARLAYEEALRTAQEDVRRALLDLRTAETALALSLDQQQAAEAEYAQVSDLYRSQEATSLDIQSSEANLADARRAVVVSRIAKLIADLGVQFAAGDLKSAVLKEAQP